MPAKKCFIQTTRIVMTSKLFPPVTIHRRAGTESHKRPEEDALKRLVIRGEGTK